MSFLMPQAIFSESEQGLMLLASPWMSFRTWRPRRGPVRALLKDEHSMTLVWLTGVRAALWESIESGTTLARLRRQAESLRASDDLELFVARLLESGAAYHPSGRAALVTRPDAPAPLPGDPTDEAQVQAWMAAQGYPFEARWPLASTSTSMREAMDRLDFLRESGVFQIQFELGSREHPDHPSEPFGSAPRCAATNVVALAAHIRTAARAQGFACI